MTVRKLRETIDSLMMVLTFAFGYLQIVLAMRHAYSSATDVWASAMFTCCAVVIFLWFLARIGLVVFSAIKKQDIEQEHFSILIVLIVLAFSLILSTLIDSGFHISSLSYFDQVLAFLCSLVFLFLMVTACPCPFAREAVFLLNIIGNIFVCVFFCNGTTQFWNSHAPAFTDLTLNFSNPNSAAEFLSVAIAFSVVAVLKSKLIVVRFASVLSAAFAFVLLTFTTARGPFLALGLAVVLSLLYWALSRKKPNKTLLATLVVFPAIYATILIAFLCYVDLHEISAIKSIAKELLLYPRYYIWCEYLQKMLNGHFFGIYNSVCGAGAIVNYHNSMLGTFVLYGPAGFILTIAYLYRLLFKQQHPNDAVFIKDFPMFVLEMFVLLLGMNEGAMFICSGGFFIVGFSVFGFYGKDFGFKEVTKPAPTITD